MSQFSSPDYDLSRPSGVCALTGEPLAPGESYIATLCEEGDGFVRQDVSTAAWEAGQRPEQLFSYWKAVVPEPNEKKKLFVDDTVLLSLLRRLEDAEQPTRIAFRFVLMLILMRKKMLRYDRTERRLLNNEAGQAVEQDWWILTPKLDPSKGPLGKWNNEETIEVLDPHLDEQGVRDVTDQLSEILQAEL